MQNTIVVNVQCSPFQLVMCSHIFLVIAHCNFIFCNFMSKQLVGALITFCVKVKSIRCSVLFVVILVCKETSQNRIYISMLCVWQICLFCQQPASQLTHRQPGQNGVLTDQLCRTIYCTYLSIMPMHVAVIIT